MNNASKSKISIGRRRALKLMAAGMAVGSGLLSTSLPAYSQGTTGNAKRILTVYFSRTGGTRQVADRIHSSIGGDKVELAVVTPYPSDYHSTTVQAKQELQDDFRSPLSTRIDNLGDYDVILLGSPIWWGTFSMPMRTFLYTYDLSGKIVAPFVTHEGSGLGSTSRDLRSFCPNSTVKEGLAIHAGSVNGSERAISRWISQLAI